MSRVFFDLEAREILQTKFSEIKDDTALMDKVEKFLIDFIKSSPNFVTENFFYGSSEVISENIKLSLDRVFGDEASSGLQNQGAQSWAQAQQSQSRAQAQQVPQSRAQARQSSRAEEEMRQLLERYKAQKLWEEQAKQYQQPWQPFQAQALQVPQVQYYQQPWQQHYHSSQPLLNPEQWDQIYREREVFLQKALKNIEQGNWSQDKWSKAFPKVASAGRVEAATPASAVAGRVEAASARVEAAAAGVEATAAGARAAGADASQRANRLEGDDIMRFFG